MEACRWLWSVLVLLLVVSSPALSQTRPAYFKDGGELLLRPAVVPETITSVEWQFESSSGVNQVVQWVKDKLPLVYYDRFKGRAELTMTTGELRLSGMKSSDEGTFTVEINNVQQSVKFEAKLMKELTPPEILVKPLSCNAQSRRCTLVCSVETHQAEPVTYSWSLDDGPWEEGLKDRPIVNQKFITDADANVKSYRCRVKNHVSQQDSKPLLDLFSRTTPPPVDNGLVVGVVLGVMAGLLLVVTGILYHFKEREPIRKCWSALSCANENPPPQPANGEPANKAESVPLSAGTENAS